MYQAMYQRVFGFVIAAVVITVMTACQEDSGQNAPDQTVEVRMTDMAFAPGTIAADAGQQVRMLFRNDGAVSHDFTIREMPHGEIHMMGGATGDDHMHGAEANAIHIAVDPGTTATLDLETTEGGTFEFFCSVAGHREAGMAGSFTVR